MKCFEAEEVLLKKTHKLLKYTVEYQKIRYATPSVVECWGKRSRRFCL